MKRYNPKEIEPKWQTWWDEQQTYRVDLNSEKPKYIGMGMFNYPSGAGIHIGHAMNYTISDVMARFMRQLGHESYHPVGWDAFGMPAENYAIKAGVSPQASMAKIIPEYHKQYKAMGWSNDWSKEISTHLPEYYKWTQWIFSEMYRAGLAYQDARQQWWCDKCQTVLANEQVLDDKCWRHDSPDDPEVGKREIKQWFFKITDYADELLEATDALDWTESVKTAQKNWIGKSKGAKVQFVVEGATNSIEVFTTRPDTLFGASFLVLAPEHELVGAVTTADKKADVDTYLKLAAKKDEVERQANKDKTGVFTGGYAVNPANGQKIPIWVADYVLVGYGTGAIMAVPAHDERDYEFAQKFELPIIDVVEPITGTPQKDPEARSSIVAIVHDESTDKLLTINWGPNAGGNLFVGGGREENEDVVDCARREVAEETGYTDLEYVGQTSRIHHSYFAHSKQIARKITATGVLFRLKSQQQTAPNLEDDEVDKFSVEWLSVDGAHKQVKDELHSLCLQLLLSNERFTGEGVMTNSGTYDGLSSAEMREQIVTDLAKKNQAKAETIYKIRDWSVSRQRYWGAPIPIVHCQDCGPVLVPDTDLPVVLPVLEDFKPSGDGRSALARANDWLKVSCPDCGVLAERETDTIDTYVCSSWYMLRYVDPTNNKQAFDPKVANHWMPIDFYNGGDHATAHMLYARFITRFFYKQGLLEDPEPFKRFLFNGKVTAHDGTMFSKSKGNGVDPLEIINDGYGADALRTYLMFASPLELWTRWDAQGVPGAYRFLNRVFTLVQEFNKSEYGDEENSVIVRRIINQAIDKATADIHEQKYNTAISALMKATNELYIVKADEGFQSKRAWQEALEALVMLIAPFAPHTAEELWQDLGHNDSVNIDHWPLVDKQYLVQDEITVGVQVNGKVRGEITFAKDTPEADVLELAKQQDGVERHIEGKPIKKEIYIPGRIVNLVV